MKQRLFHTDYVSQVKCCGECSLPSASLQHCSAFVHLLTFLQFFSGLSQTCFVENFWERSQQSLDGCQVVQNSLNFPGTIHRAAISPTLVSVVVISSPGAF